MVAICLVSILAAMWIIWRACDGFEVASEYLGRKLSDGVRGATINAIGSSIPELLTTAIALIIYLNVDGFAFGIATTAGSAIFNSAVIPGLCILAVINLGIVSVISVSKKVAIRDGLFLIGGELLLIAILSHGEITAIHGAILLCYYMLYVTVLLTTMKSKRTFYLRSKLPISEQYQGFLSSLVSLDIEKLVLKNKGISGKKAWLILTISISIIAAACYILVEACYAMGDAIGVRTYFVAVILAAAATSVPDTMLSVKDALSGEYDDAVSNALGSNIFDICICLGLPLLLYCLITGQHIDINITNQQSVAELRVFLLIQTIILFLIFIIGKGMGRLKGYIMMFLYISFVTFIIARAYNNNIALKIGGYLQLFLNDCKLPF